MTFKKSVIGSVAAVALTVGAAFASVPAQSSSCSYQFNANLRLGAVSTDVQNLQKLLNMDAATKVASTGAGSMGYETLRFGPATFAAVKKFQAANAISPMSGYVGPLTRAALNTICTGNGNQTNTNTNTGSGVSSNSIPVSVLVEGQAGAKLGEFVVSGNGMVTNITLQRIGLSNNSTLQNVYLYDGATRLTDGASVRTDGSISFNSTSGLFVVSGSKTITVRADVCKSTISGCPTSTSGQTVGVALTGVTMMGGQSTPVSGVNGPLFSISSATTASANFTNSSATVNPAATTINPGSVNQTVWSDTLSIGTNPVKFSGATFKMVGSAPANALSNVRLYVDGVERGMASINAMNQFVFTMSSPVMLNTGSHTVDVRADVVAGASRFFYISLERGTDIIVEDSTLSGINVGVTTSYPTSGSALNIRNAGTITIGSVTTTNSSVTMTQDPDFNNTTNVVGGASQVTIGKFKITAYSEDVKFISLPVKIYSNNMNAATGGVLSMANVGLYLNGAQVGSNINPFTLASGTDSTAQAINGLGSNLYIPSGQTVTVEVRADIMNSASSPFTAGTIIAKLAAGQVQGISSSVVSATSEVAGQSLSVGNTVVFGTTSGFASGVRAPNSQNVKIGSFSLQAGNAEDLTVNDIAVYFPNTLGENSMVAANQLTTLVIKDGSTMVGTPIGSPVGTSSNSFSGMNLIVPKSTTKVFDVYANFGSASTGLSAKPSMLITYRGNVSNQTGYTNGNSALAASAATTVGTAALATTNGVTLNTGASPVSQIVVGNQSSYKLGTINFKSNGTAGAVIKDVTISTTPNSMSKVFMNGKEGTVVSNTATIYNVGTVVSSDAAGINVDLLASLTCAGTAGTCAATSLITGQATITSVTFYDGAQTQASSSLAIGTPVAYIAGSKPVVSMAQTSNQGLTNGLQKLAEFTVAADAAGAIRLSTIGASTSASTVTIDTGAGTAELRILGDASAISGSSCSVVSTDIVCTLPANYDFTGTKSFAIYATVNGALGASGSSAVTVKLGQGTFGWYDITGGNTSTALNGALLNGFTSNTWTTRN